MAMNPAAPPPAAPAAPPPAAPPRVNLALQGGGSHGAFTWGVLDALLADGRIDFDGVTGASAGAMNAVVVTHGWLEGIDAREDPRETARQALADFWHAVGAQPSAFSYGGAAPLLGPAALGANPWLLWSDLVSRVLSPYQLNPLDYNPLRQVLRARVDFARLRARSPFRLFVCATNVRTGRPRVFREHELVLEMLLASACLPFAFQAVRIDGEAYWDGGFTGNPALYPLFYATDSADLLLVQINPLARDGVPDTAREIVDRVNEISFNASLLQELRAIAFVQRLVDEGRIDPQRYRRVRLHVIDGGAELARFGAASKSITDPGFLRELFELGRRSARAFLEDRLVYVGHAATTRIPESYL